MRAANHDSFYGFQIIESQAMVETYQHRFPRSKKKRIRKKWTKRPNNFKTRPRKDFLRYENKFICHPVVARELRYRMMVYGNIFMEHISKDAFQLSDQRY